MADRINERFQLDRAIEESPEGAWYRGTDEKTQKAVLIATLTRAADEWTREGFEKFQDLGRRVSHPAIARFVESGRTEDDSAYLVIDLPAGPTLADRLLITPPLSAHELVRMSISLLDGLQAAHRQGIIHGDIEPGAILVTGEGRAALTRFGLNRAAAIARRIPSFDGVKLARSKRMAAPELLRGEQPTIASDLYSIGAILYEALAGRGHRAEPSPDAEPLGLREVRPQVPGALAEVIDRLVSNDPEARPDSASTLRRELTQAMMKAPTIAKLKVATAIEEPTPEPTQQLNIEDLEQEMGYAPPARQVEAPPSELAAPVIDTSVEARDEAEERAAAPAAKPAADSPSRAPAAALDAEGREEPAKKPTAILAIAILVIIVLGLVFAMSGGDEEAPPEAPQDPQGQEVGQKGDQEIDEKIEPAAKAPEPEPEPEPEPKSEPEPEPAAPTKAASTMSSSTMSASTMSSSSTTSSTTMSSSSMASGGLKTNPGF